VSSSRPPEPPGRPTSKLRVTTRGWLVLALVVAAVLFLAGRAVLGGARAEPTSSSTGHGTTTGPSSTPATTDDASPGVASLPRCRYAVLPAPDAHYGTWERTLLDTTFALPEDYTPPDLVSVSRAGSGSAELVRSLVIPDLRALLRASGAAGNPVEVLIAYRSFARQQALFQQHVRDDGRAAALARTARPGHSEHQLGTTIDFRTKGELDVPENWESQPAGAWMAANAWRFVFLMSYPRGRQDVTCYSYEPWHYRYFGRALAARIHDSGLTPREFLWRLDSTAAPAPGSSGSA
jgi:D-alanyl-D-alanine carboxypeptidase